MDRVQRQSDREAIAFALGLIPEPVRDLVSRAHFLARTDPVKAGLHSDEWTGGTIGRPTAETAHVCWSWSLDGPADRSHPTVVLPLDEDFTPEVIVHELGHVLDELTGFSCPTPRARLLVRGDLRCGSLRDCVPDVRTVTRYRRWDA